MGPQRSCRSQLLYCALALQALARLPPFTACLAGRSLPTLQRAPRRYCTQATISDFLVKGLQFDHCQYILLTTVWSVESVNVVTVLRWQDSLCNFSALS